MATTLDDFCGHTWSTYAAVRYSSDWHKADGGDVRSHVGFLKPSGHP